MRAAYQRLLSVVANDGKRNAEQVASSMKTVVKVPTKAQQLKTRTLVTISPLT